MLTFLAWPHRILRAIEIRIEALRKQERIYRLFSLIVECVLLTNCRMCAGVTSVHLREGKMLSKRASKHHSGLKKDSGKRPGWSTDE